MFTFIATMFVGIGAGYLLRKIQVLQKVGITISYTIYLLLFMLGLSVGANRMIIENLPTLGGTAFLMALGTTLGSVIAARIVYQYFFKKKEDNHER